MTIPGGGGTVGTTLSQTSHRGINRQAETACLEFAIIKNRPKGDFVYSWCVLDLEWRSLNVQLRAHASAVALMYGRR